MASEPINPDMKNNFEDRGDTVVLYDTFAREMLNGDFQNDLFGFLGSTFMENGAFERFLEKFELISDANDLTFMENEGVPCIMNVFKRKSDGQCFGYRHFMYIGETFRFDMLESDIEFIIPDNFRWDYDYLPIGIIWEPVSSVVRVVDSYKTVPKNFW